MDITFSDYFKHLELLIVSNKFSEAFYVSTTNTQEFSTNEMAEFFFSYEISNSYFGISGSGGSGIKKPNLTTLAAYHASKILVKYSETTIIKFGSRKKTSLSGSIDFGEKINNKDFILKNDEIFMKVISYLTFNSSIKKFMEEYYISSIPVEKKIIFVKNKEQAIRIYKKKHPNQKLKIIYGFLNGKEIDEIIPTNYFILEEGKEIQNKCIPNPFNCSDYVIHSLDEIHLYNEQLLLGVINNKAWGYSLFITIIEILSFYLELSFSETEKIVNKYFSNKKYLIVFDLDGSLLNKNGEIPCLIKEKINKLANFASIGVSTGASLQSAIKRTQGINLNYTMANYGAVLLSKNNLTEFFFEKNLVLKLLNVYSYYEYTLINSTGATLNLKAVQKLILYTNDFFQFTHFLNEVDYYFYDTYVEISPIGGKARMINYIKSNENYSNFIAIGNDENDSSMFNISDIYYSILFDLKVINKIFYILKENNYFFNLNFILDNISKQIGGKNV